MTSYSLRPDPWRQFINGRHYHRNLCHITTPKPDGYVFRDHRRGKAERRASHQSNFLAFRLLTWTLVWGQSHKRMHQTFWTRLSFCFEMTLFEQSFVVLLMVGKLHQLCYSPTLSKWIEKRRLYQDLHILETEERPFLQRNQMPRIPDVEKPHQSFPTYPRINRRLCPRRVRSTDSNHECQTQGSNCYPHFSFVFPEMYRQIRALPVTQEFEKKLELTKHHGPVGR